LKSDNGEEIKAMIVYKGTTMVHWVVGIIGAVVTVLLEIKFFGAGVLRGLSYVVISNTIGFASLLLTLRAEGVRWIRHHVLTRSLATWGLLSAFWLTGHYLLIRDFRSLAGVALLIIPLIMSDGLMFSSFGWVQDHIVRRSQRKLVR